MQRRFDENPYPDGSDEAAIWDLLVKIPLEAFLKDDLSWGETAIDKNFFLINAGQHASPDGWRLLCSGRKDYLKFWQEENAPLKKIDFAEDLRMALYRCAVVSQIEILHSTGTTTNATTAATDTDTATATSTATSTAIARRMIVGGIAVKGGKAPLSLLPYKKMTMTLIQLQKKAGRWTLASMITSLPREEIAPPSTSTPPAEQDHAKSHSVDDSITNAKKLDARILSSLPAIGPYSPVRHVPIRSGRLITVSGQLGMTADGVSVGPDITSQTRQIMKNAEDALRAAHASLADVFKTTVYITDLKYVKAFNEVYGEFFQEPQPARALVTSNLPKDFLVEVEFWAMQ